jgi:hypothetical protein
MYMRIVLGREFEASNTLPRRGRHEALEARGTDEVMRSVLFDEEEGSRTCCLKASSAH